MSTKRNYFRMSNGEESLENLENSFKRKRILLSIVGKFHTKFSLPSYFSRYDRGKPLRPCHPYVAILSRKRISPRRAVHVACIRSGTNGASSTIERDGNPRLFDREFSKYLSYLRIQSGLKTWSEKLTASPLIRAHFRDHARLEVF